MQAMKCLPNNRMLVTPGRNAYSRIRSLRKLHREMSRSNSAYGTAEAEIAHSTRPRRPVVTAFIRRDDGKLLVVRRSDKVSTYQQLWGGVSGGVEGNESLLNRALTEIVEETGLAPHQLQLVAFGRPLPVDDGRRRFLVYPFLFQLIDAGAQVTLNWENVAFDWVPPSGVPRLQHVPLLPETVRRLLLPPYMQTHVQYLKSDRQHGASELAAYVLQALHAVVAHEERTAPSSSSSSSTAASIAAANPLAAAAAAAAAAANDGQQQQQPTFEGAMEAYRNFCFHMAVARPSMAAVANCAADVMLQLQQQVAARADAFEPTAGMARVALTDTITKLSGQLQQKQAAVVSNGAAILKDGMVVLTTSLSSTVAKVLIQAHQQAQAAATAGATAAAAAAAATAATPPPAAAAVRRARSPSTAAISAGVALGAAGNVNSSAAAAAGAQVEASAAAAGKPQRRSQPSIDLEDWVDDPEFWPSSSGIGRDYTTSGLAGSSSSWSLQLGLREGRKSSRRPSRRGPGISVIVCESRPLCEGVTMARRLAAAGMDVTVITDAQAGVFIEEADVVLLGADAVTPDGVVNKVGSKLLALAGKAQGVPVVAVTECMKISPGPVSAVALPNTSLQEGEEEKDVSEVLQGWKQEVTAAVQKLMTDGAQQAAAAAAAASVTAAAPEEVPVQAVEGTGKAAAAAAAAAVGALAGAGASAGDASALAPGGSIQVRNVYFEAVPLQYLTGLVTDKGFLSQFVVAQMIKQRAQEYQQAFGLAVCEDMVVS